MADACSYSNTAPLVSCIMPTYNRRAFVPHAIRYFLRQDYAAKELIIIDDGDDCIEDLVPLHPAIRYYRLPSKITLGAKLNMACVYAQGNIIANWDDDDWYAPGRLTYQVRSLQQEQVYINGINKLLYFDLKTKKAFQYQYPANQRTWLLGSSLCFRKTFWEKSRFAEIDVGMDGLFVWSTTDEHIHVLEDNTFSVHMIHQSNISPKKTDSGWWYTHPVDEIRMIMQDDWPLYSTNGNHPTSYAIKGYQPGSSIVSGSQTVYKNVHACLVHEREDCIIDLVRNLHYYDPDSVILLYNGGEDKQLFKSKFPYEEFGAVIYPDPVPVKWGYLHPFALKCMEFALAAFSFDTFTIVDSDQLCTRKGYSQQVGNYLQQHRGVGMLSSVPEKISSDNRTNPVALQAYKEYDLWKPLLQTFPDGENKFVHWTFWPSAVFTAQAAKDLLALFSQNELLQEIMARTKIWATEEVILPTLIRLLGYEIEKNPCSYDYVKYKVTYTTQQAGLALKKPDVYWMHPVDRKYDNAVRKYHREQANHYVQTDQQFTSSSIKIEEDTKGRIKQIEKIEGWLSTPEALLLTDTVTRACREFDGDNVMMEVGSYHGKATVLIGSVLQQDFPSVKIISIDPHDGILGAADKGIVHVEPSWEKLKENIRINGLDEQVELIREHAYNVKWGRPLSFLLIDGLHDYPSVAADFWQFAEWIKPGGYVAFHDYADYYPGVKAFVNELLELSAYSKIQLAESLIILQKV